VAVGPCALEDVVSAPTPGFWQGRRVLLTGQTGFKGAWLALWLARLGARVTALALEPATRPNLFTLARVGTLCDNRIGDIRHSAPVLAAVQAAQPEVVLHLAAQALVRTGYRAPLDTFSTNVMGTAKVLEAVRGTAGVRVVVVVTTDKVYRNRESTYPYREEDALGGHDPYSASKAAAELVAASYRDSYLAAQGVALATARAGNVIGGGDWSEDRLVPDAVRAWQSGTSLQVRRPQAVRPWQHVLEPLAAYLRLAEALWHQPALAGAYNFGPYAHEAATVGAVIGMAREAFGRGDTAFGDGREGPHEAGWLALETSTAREVLGVRPRWELREAVSRTLQWYARQAEGADARALCEADIAAFERKD
jgi:CDP-glucose 4,6-dehydratase